MARHRLPGDPVIAQFLGPMRLEDVDGAHALLLEPLKFYSARHRGIFVVPPGFATDFASIPRGLWNLIPKRGKHDRAAVLHDAGYRGVIQTKSGQRVRLTRELVDALFLEGMAAAGVGWLTRSLMYRAVRLFGATAYDAGQVKVAAR